DAVRRDRRGGRRQRAYREESDALRSRAAARGAGGVPGCGRRGSGRARGADVMTCAEIKDRTIDYLYGELPAEGRVAFEPPLAGCDACRAEVAGLQGTLLQTRAAGELTDEPPP